MQLQQTSKSFSLKLATLPSITHNIAAYGDRAKERNWKHDAPTAAYRGLIYNKAAGGISPDGDALAHLVSL